MNVPPKGTQLLIDYDVRCNTLFSRVILFSTLMMILNLVEDLQDNWIVIVLDLIVIFVFGITYFLNVRNFHLLAKVLYFILISSIIFYFSAATYSRNSVSLTFFPFAAIMILVMGNKNRVVLYSMLFTLLCMVTYLEYNSYLISWIAPIGTPSKDPISTAINVICSFATLAFTIFTLSKVNGEADQALLQQQEELKKANQELDRFVYSISHDLRAPLASIKGLIQVANLENNQTKLTDYLKHIENRVNKLDDFVKEIIDYSRNTSTQVELTEIDFPSIVQEVIENLKFQDYAGQITFCTNYKITRTIHLDKSRLKIVLNNLISNAIKYADKKKAESIVTIDCQTLPHKTVLTISDNGIGIGEEHAPKIFTMFYRATDQAQGSGLGLYIVKEMIEKMHGQISLETDLGKGTSFRIVFDS